MILYTTLIDDERQRNKFEEIYLLFYKDMYMYAMAILHNSSNAEDVVHDVFLKVATKHMNTIEKMPSNDDIKYYLLRSTKNTAYNYLKSKEHINLSINDIQEKPESYGSNISDEDFINQLCIKADYQTLMQVVNNLKEPYYEVLYYRFVLEYKPKQIAKLLDKKESTIKKQILRAKKIVIKEIDKIRGFENVNDEK